MTAQLLKAPWADMQVATPQRADIWLSGSGIGVDLLATILARGGARVTVCSAGGAAAEPVAANTVPYTAELLYLLADRFAVPEIADLAMFGRLPESLQATSGVKQSLGFLYHRPGRAHDRSENLQFSVPGEHAEWHAYLPQVQRHTRKLAERYGVRYVDGQSPDAGALQIRCTGSPSAGGRRIAGTAIFEQVEPFEESRPPKDGGYTQPWSEGTTVHGFRGGWVQVASFNNHPGARNSGCAVSISVPATEGCGAGTDLDDLLGEICRRYPDIGLQLRGARRQGEWRQGEWRQGEWRQTGAAVVGEPAENALVLQLGLDRGEVLFGQDFTLMLELVHGTAAMLLEPGALASAERTAAALRQIERFQRSLLTENEAFALSGRIATRGFESWNAFLRAWLLWSISSALALKKIRLDAVASGDWSAASKFDAGIGWFDLAPGIAAIVARAARTIQTIEDSVLPSVAAERVFTLLSQPRLIPPLYKFGKPAARRYRLNLPTRLKLLAWTFTVAPKAYRGMLTADNITAIPNEEISRPSESR